MKNKLLAANWKSNKTKFEAKDWLVEVSKCQIAEGLEVVLFPPFTLLDIVSGYIRVNSMPFKIGAQDISPFDLGAYTGEIAGAQIKEFAEYVLIGHSERRSSFSEGKEMVRKKVEKAKTEGLTPIVCISELSQIDNLISSEDVIIAYEPPGAISTSSISASPENPQEVLEYVKKIKANFKNDVIYGGSVDHTNIKNYLSLENISGALIGGQSLDPNNFINIIKNAS